MNLLNRNGKQLELKDKEKIFKYINLLEIVANKNSTKKAIEKLNSLLASETFLSLFTEGEIFSRRDIKKIFNDKVLSSLNELKMIKNFSLSYKFVLSNKQFSIANLFTLYNLLSQEVIKDNDKLLDGHMFRHEDVFIGAQKKIRKL